MRYLIVFFIVAVTGCSTLTHILHPPKVKFKDVKLRDANLQTAWLDVMLEVENSNDTTAIVDRLKYNLKVGERDLAAGVFDQKVELPPKQITLVAVPISVRFQDLFVSALDMLQKKGAPYFVNGTVGVGAFDIPFDASGRIEIKDL